jgi:hypothetical protein
LKVQRTLFLICGKLNLRQLHELVSLAFVEKLTHGYSRPKGTPNYRGIHLFGKVHPFWRSLTHAILLAGMPEN